MIEVEGTDYRMTVPVPLCTTGHDIREILLR